jgi:membrane-bound serine protease (ClpP class)
VSEAFVRRLAIKILVVALAGAVGASLAGGAAQAEELAPVDVFEASGYFDDVILESVLDAIDRAEDGSAQALILQLDTRGTLVDRDRLQGLLERVANAEVPIAVWVAPARASRAYGEAAQLMAVADVTAMVGGSRIGYIGEPFIVNGAPISFGAATEQLVDGSLSFNDARDAGVLKLPTSDEGVPTLLNMINLLDGQVVDGVELDTATPVLGDDGAQQQATTGVLSKPDLVDALMHTVASPSTAYLLFIIGLALLIFEFYTAGVGIGGVVGATCLVLGCYGLAALPTRPISVILILAAMLAFAVDVQVGIPRLWTTVGAVLFSFGSFTLYRPLVSDNMRLGWLTLLTGIGGILLTFVVGMPSMVRTRFATPTIGREWMIGEMGSATTSVSPDGVVLVAGARWRARTNRATPIAAGAAVRVVAIDGVTLEVEPEEGAARDYRERRSTS